jgi:hypothetical protein
MYTARSQPRTGTPKADALVDELTDDEIAVVEGQ